MSMAMLVQGIDRLERLSSSNIRRFVKRVFLFPLNCQRAGAVSKLHILFGKEGDQKAGD